jgi:hypothetical protein
MFRLRNAYFILHVRIMQLADFRLISELKPKKLQLKACRVLTGVEMCCIVLESANKELLMNIFVTSECPEQCAAALDDKRVVKMVLETAQLLSTALIYHGHSGAGIYKSTHVNHPSCVWARKTQANYLWTLRHFAALGVEYAKRYGKVHKSLGLIDAFIEHAHIIPKGGLTAFANCAANKSIGISYKDEACVYSAYQLYLNDRWDTDKRTPTWYGKAA